MQQKTNTTTEVAAKKLPLASRLEQTTSKDTDPPAPHPTLPPEPFTLAVFPNFTDCIAELFIKTVCNKNSYTLQLYKFLQFSPSSWTEATSKGKP